jgi:hypothetical protein
MYSVLLFHTSNIVLTLALTEWGSSKQIHEPKRYMNPKGVAK